MLNELLSLVGIHRTGMVVQIVSNVVNAFEKEYEQEPDARLAALDAFIALLQVHRNDVAAQKNAPPKDVPPVPPAPPA